MRCFHDIRLPVLLVTLALATVAPVRADFLGASNFDAAVLLPSPPSRESAEVRGEIEQILRLQETRTPADVAAVCADVNLTVLAFTNVLGAWFATANLPLTTALFESLARESKAVSERAKLQFARARPPQADARVQIAVAPLTDSSYPSGHAARGMLFALILADLVPDQRAALLERGREIGWERVIAGVHYPSDVAAGRVLGQAMAVQLLRDSAFQRELARARNKCDAVRAKHAAP